MSLVKKVKTVYLKGSSPAEEAEDLLEWLLVNPKGAVNLKECRHIHTAVLQVLMVCAPRISVRPVDQGLEKLLVAAALMPAK